MTKTSTSASRGRNCIKILNHRNIVREKQRTSRSATYEKLRTDIENGLISLCHNTNHNISLAERVLVHIGYGRVSQDKLDFIDYLRNFEFPVLKEAFADFLFNAVEKYDPKKGSKRALFRAILASKERDLKSGTLERSSADQMRRRVRELLGHGVTK